MDYIYKSFEKQYLQHVILRVLFENNKVHFQDVPNRIINMLSKDDINEMIWERPINIILSNLADEIKYLITLGYIKLIEPDVFEITEEGKEILKKVLINPEFLGAYIQWKTINTSNESVNLARESARWSKYAALIAMISTIIATILTLVQILK